MELVQVVTFVFVVSLLVVSPGPNGLLIAKTVSLYGKIPGFINVAGFMAAFYVHGVLSVLGISLLLVQSAQAFFVFKIVGAIYLIWLGFKSILSAWQKKTILVPNDTEKSTTNVSQEISNKNAFLEGFLTNALNPKVSMFYLAAFPQFMPTDASVLQAFSLVFIHSFINCLWFTAMIVVLSKAKRVALSSRFVQWLKTFTGVVFIGFGAKLALLKAVD